MLRVCEGWMGLWVLLERRGGAQFIARGGRGYVSPPELSGRRREATRGVREGARSSAITRRLSTLADEHREEGEKKTGAQVHCGFWPRRTRARCSVSGVGERQGEVKGEETEVVARCGSRRRALDRSHAKQRRGRSVERVGRVARAVSSRGHDAIMVKTTPTCCLTLSLVLSVQCLV